MSEVKAPQRSKEWFQARKGRITGSIAGAILGLNPWQTPEDAMRTMVREYHGAEREFQGNVATEWGTHNEATAQFDYELETGNTVTECGFFEYEDWLGASPDGLIGDNGLIEIKCPFGIRNKENPEFKDLIKDLPYYYAQVQIEMLCAGRDFVDFYQWTPSGTDLQTTSSDGWWLTQNLPILKAFHARFLKEKDNSIHLEPRRPTINKKEALQLVAEIDDLSEAVALATERKTQAMAELVAMTDGRSSIIGDRLLTNVERAGAVSYAKMVKRLRPNLTSAYMDKFRGKPSSYWKLS